MVATGEAGALWQRRFGRAKRAEPLLGEDDTTVTAMLLLRAASSRHRLSVGLMWPLSGLLGTAAPRCGTAAGQRRGWRLPRPPAISRETIAVCYRSKAVRHSSAAVSWVKKYRVGDAMMVMFRRLHIFLSCAITAFRYYT